VAVVVISEDGVRIEAIKSGTTSVLEKVADGISRAVRTSGGEKDAGAAQTD
jgi:uncharacterized spore protein YtfJ